MFDVCEITTIHRPFDARIYERSFKCLSENGFTVCLISTWDKPDNFACEQWISVAPPKNRTGRLLHGFKVFRCAMRQQVKAYHFHDIDFLLWGILLKILKRVPVVYDCHENYPIEIRHHKEWISPILRPPLALLARLIEDCAVRYFKHCVVVVPYQVQRFSKLGANIALVRNFANLVPKRDLTHGKALICSGSISVSYGAEILLNIGRVLRKRNIDLKLIVADRFISNDLKNRFCETVENEHLPIDIHPNVKPSMIDTFLSKGFIGIAVEQNTPEKTLAIPTKLFEYMATGLPIIASDLPLTKEIIHNSKSGITVTSDDANQYVDAVEYLLSNPLVFSEMREHGFNAIENEYSWKNEKETLVKFFKGIVGN
jgi:hypothetical protein